MRGATDLRRLRADRCVHVLIDLDWRKDVTRTLVQSGLSTNLKSVHVPEIVARFGNLAVIFLNAKIIHITICTNELV